MLSLSWIDGNKNTVFSILRTSLEQKSEFATVCKKQYDDLATRVLRLPNYCTTTNFFCQLPDLDRERWQRLSRKCIKCVSDINPQPKRYIMGTSFWYTFFFKLSGNLVVYDIRVSEVVFSIQLRTERFVQCLHNLMKNDTFSNGRVWHDNNTAWKI